MKFTRLISAVSASPARPATAVRFHRLHRGQRVLAALALSGGVCLLQACPGPKPAPEPTATPTPAPTVAAATPTPTPEASPTPTPDLAKYTGEQQMEYIKTAQQGFLETRQMKAEPYGQANAAYMEAGGASAKGLTSKEAITERRALIDKVRQANEDYLAFVNTQNDVYRAELAKTPLTPGDIDSLVQDFSTKSKLNEVKKLRESLRDLLKVGDEMMAYLAKTYGSWTLNGTRPAFKKPSDQNQYAALGKKYNALVSNIQQLQAVANAPLPTPGASPLPSVSPGPAANAAPTATVASPTVSPAKP